jgi:predicted secreted hydrolase
MSGKPLWTAALLLALVPGAAAPQGYAGLDTGGAGFAPVTAPARLAFPRDHGPHPGFRLEWWYVTANLTGPDGTGYGAQWTLFRQATAPGPGEPGWSSNQIWMGHAAVTSASLQRTAETFARGGIGQAGVEAAPFHAWIDAWDLAATAAPAGADALARLRLTAAGDGFAYDLALSTDRPPVLQGDAGYSVKSTAGQASYYYSQPFFTVTGTLTLDGRGVPVTGSAWLDREWSSQPLAAGQEGWDWFALHLDTGEALMAYRLRSRDGPPFLAATWIDAHGRPEPLAPGAVTVTPGATAEVAGRTLPVRWRLTVPSHGLAVDTEPLNAQSWMGTTFPYWEGPIRFTGTHAGRGYLEMTGY